VESPESVEQTPQPSPDGPALVVEEPEPETDKADDDSSDVTASLTAGPIDRASVMDALRRNDVEALLSFADHLRTEARDSDLPARLEGMASLARGDVLHGLLHLRQAARDADHNSAATAGAARLALAVGLLKAGRSEDAMLEALSALARARRAEDERGMHACVRLLRQLALSSGFADLAERWHEQAPSASTPELEPLSALDPLPVDDESDTNEPAADLASASDSNGDDEGAATQETTRDETTSDSESSDQDLEGVKSDDGAPKPDDSESAREQDSPIGHEDADGAASEDERINTDSAGASE
jgi:hypothetical protein